MVILLPHFTYQYMSVKFYRFQTHQNYGALVTVENHVTSKEQQWRIPLKNLDSGKLSLIYPLILVRFAWGLKQIPRENDSNRSIVCDFQTKIC